MWGDATSGQYSGRGEKSASPALPPLRVHETVSPTCRPQCYKQSRALLLCEPLSAAESMSEGFWGRGLSPEHQHAEEVGHRRE